MASDKKKNYSTEGLNSRQEVQDALASAGYRPSEQVTEAEAALKAQQSATPGDYQSRYQDQIDRTLNDLNARRVFHYNYAQDPLYQQYAQAYTQNAHNASADAAAQAAALTGGYGSSYAASVAQQAYQQQIGALSEAIPTLYRLALDTYTGGGEELVTKLDQLGAREQNDQNLYNNELADYYTQLQQKGDAYNAAYAQDYGQYQDYLNRLDTLYGYYAAQEQQAQVALFGHTHIPYCRQEGGLWLLNPGACGGRAPSCGIVTVDGGKAVCCVKDLLLEETL